MTAVRMDVSPETKLNQQLTFSYKSFAGSSQLGDGSSPGDLNKNHAATDLNHLPKEIPLKQLVSGSPNGFDSNLPKPKEADQDSSSQDTLTVIQAVSIGFGVGVAIVLILHIYFGQSLVFVKGALVSDHERCTALGQEVLNDRGSSVDAAITAALCLGVVHPHVSGVGGGGVMLIHDIHRNKTSVINFQGAAPKIVKEEMLQNVPEPKAGLQVGVPGMLLGLHHAHSLYGSLPWDDVVTRAAAVAKEGFNVSFSLADAVSKVKGEQLSQHFRDMFLPNGQALSPGSVLRMPSLAGVLEAGLSNFYNGNLSQEMEDEVRAHGGVLSRDDIRNYNVLVEQPVEGLYDDFIIQVPPPPSAGATLISALNLLQNLHLTKDNTTENQTYYWSAEALKAALAIASASSHPEYNTSVTELLSDILSKSQTQVYHHMINASTTVRSRQTDLMAAQVVVMGPDDLMVSVASSLSRPFGSRIITRSGVILNSLILDFSLPNKTWEQLSTSQKNGVQPERSPLSSLMPTIVVPAGHRCGTYVALSSSGGQQSLSVIIQVLISVLSLPQVKNDSLSLRRLPLQLQPNRLHVNSDKLPAEGVQSLYNRGHVVPVLGIQRNKDVITAINTSSII